MKKGVVILAGAVLVAMSGLTDIALNFSEDPQWTPYVLSWDRKLKTKNRLAKKEEAIPLCSSKIDSTADLQR
jgi:hypothetical protein